MRPGRHAAALVACAALLACGGGAAEAEPPGGSEAPNVLLVTIDTLRADALGCYGYPLDTSPHLDGLAAEGVRFADCSVQWPKTWPSMASLVTGAYPRTTGIRVEHRALPPSFPLLSELFVAGGFAAGAVVANWNVGRTLGFDRGFDHFVESWQARWRAERGNLAYENAPGRVKRYTDAGLVTDQGLAWLDRLEEGRPFFLWLHYMDPHGPYVPPESHADLFAGRHPERRVPLETVPDYQRQPEAPGGPPSTDLGFYRAQYDREVRYLDDQLGRLLAELEQRGLAGTTLVALTADHGESFGEHSTYLEHGQLSYQDTVRVPLLLRWPEHLPAGRVVEEPVGVIDLAPTLLELAGLPVPPTHEGVSLAAVARGEGAAEHPVFTEAGYHEPAQRVVRDGRWKLIEVLAPADREDMTGLPFELYDVVADPTERENLAQREPEVVAALAARLEAWVRAAGPVPEAEEIDLSTLSDEAREMLEALGYLESAHGHDGGSR